MNKPTFDLEKDLLARGYALIAGVDEVGRGPWAGPVFAAAAIIQPHQYDFHLFSEVNDSKKITPLRRQRLFDQLMYLEGIYIGLGEASVEEIDRLNILRATKLAMQRAVEALPLSPHYVLVDGNQPPQFSCPSAPVIKGDQISISIAVASIIAKVSRDRLMVTLAESYPHYGWGRNAGYGTSEHQAALREFGVTPHHRRSFAPIAALLEIPAA